MDAVERWFGTGFARLHRRLKGLRRNGGTLHGDVALRRGRGFGGWLGGHRLALQGR